MPLDWLKFSAALALLLPPAAWWQGHRARHRALSHGWEGHWGRTLAHGAHTIDFGRALLGAWCLAEALAPASTGTARQLGLAAQAAALVIATLLQIFVCREPGSAYAPFAFVAGVVAGFLPLEISTLSLLMAAAIAVGLRRGALFFPALAALVFGLGMILTRQALALPLVLIAGVAAMPWFFTLLFPRPLVATHRAKRLSHRRHSARDELR